METRKQAQEHRPSWGGASSAHQAPRDPYDVLPTPLGQLLPLGNDVQ